MQSFLRLANQRRLIQGEEQGIENLSPDEMSFQRYFSSDHPLLESTIDKLVQDYQNNLDWFRNSRILKRETLNNEEEQSDPVEELFGATSSLSHHHRRSETKYIGQRDIRHSRKRFLEKVDRSGWGGGYG